MKYNSYPHQSMEIAFDEVTSDYLIEKPSGYFSIDIFLDLSLCLPPPLASMLFSTSLVLLSIPCRFLFLCRPLKYGGRLILMPLLFLFYPPEKIPFHLQDFSVTYSWILN